MTALRTLAEAWDEQAQLLPIDAPAEQVTALRRAFYRGALEAHHIALNRGLDALMAELVAHGRSIGTAAESAGTALPEIERRPWPLPGARRRA